MTYPPLPYITTSLSQTSSTYKRVSLKHRIYSPKRLKTSAFPKTAQQATDCPHGFLCRIGICLALLPSLPERCSLQGIWPKPSAVVESVQFWQLLLINRLIRNMSIYSPVEETAELSSKPCSSQGQILCVMHSTPEGEDHPTRMLSREHHCGKQEWDVTGTRTQLCTSQPLQRGNCRTC